MTAPIPPLDERTARLLEMAVATVGERYRELIANVYSLGVMDGQIQALDRATGIMASDQARVPQ